MLAAVGGGATAPPAEDVTLGAAHGRVLAEDVPADRDMPALSRSIRDGFAVRSADLPGRLQIIGEVRAGEAFPGEVGCGQAVEIMTGAPVPRGADAIVMVEHVERAGDAVIVNSAAPAGQFINPQGADAAAGSVVLRAGERLDYSGVALLAACGRAQVRVYRKPTVAILATGDELVDVSETPSPRQVRNSNACCLAAQAESAGGEPIILPVARDEEGPTRALIELGLSAGLLLISGGVSAGKYDFVEAALAALGAEFYFDRVLIQPGQPLVFGRARGTFFFGLPGNPASTMVTFELFARSALALLSGAREAPLLMPYARLTHPLRHRPGLTRFVPARVNADASEVTPLDWSGSGDIPALARANAYLVAEPDKPDYPAGQFIRILLK